VYVGDHAGLNGDQESGACAAAKDPDHPGQTPEFVDVHDADAVQVGVNSSCRRSRSSATVSWAAVADRFESWRANIATVALATLTTSAATAMAVSQTPVTA
jgi:hypothetical protein